MNPIAVLFSLVAAIGLVTFPRRWAPLPLLMGACYMTYGQRIELGPFHFTVIRMLILVGVFRVLIRKERPAGGMTTMDRLLVAWGVWVLVCSFFHKEVGDTLIFHLGMFYNTLGIYFLVRCFCRSLEDLAGIIKMTAILLVPVAVEMACEQFTHRNLFAIFGGVGDGLSVRNGRLRSQGPFAISILAGTVGAACAPLMIGIWRKEPLIAKIGLAACLIIVVTSASSGPLMTLVFAALALVLWRWRHLTRKMRIAAVVGYILLDLVMKAPAYYLIARIDLVGGSSGWHRAALIEAAIKHLNGWWFAGTDYTRDWMPYGVSWSEDYSDITNHYLAQGVRGGLPLMLLFISILWCGFRNVGQTLRSLADAPFQDRFLVWSLGAALFAHATAFLGIAYFDQSFVFLYLTLAATVSLRAVTIEVAPAGLVAHGPLQPGTVAAGGEHWDAAPVAVEVDRS
jgi:hypothetical protein